MKQLDIIETLLPEYKNFKIYGAVAYLDVVEDADRFAQNKKLFTIRATGDSTRITDEEGFVPRVF